ncbi:sodium-dependent transporter [Geomicrobium sp. JCM 19037]|uniref:sodium-dependent transporter n=1 Tax=unclassified Geomicrobium TaxID=2628951 RepID=UPI00045F2345|nr:sodium-dependent transporter [Geomicrobium sp. JCM 19037]GAK04263.1 sodium-dependent transporter [Geomicrobium sp. JCM 19037]
MAREHWGTKVGFILAAVGSAVGLGNIWRFPYITGEYGGGSFLLVYLLCIALIGLPVIIAEFSIGKRGQLDAVGSYRKTAPSKPWVIGGWLAVATSFLIVSFYAVITGWVLHFMFGYLTGSIQQVETGGAPDYFTGVIGSTWLPIFWLIVVMAIIMGILYFGVKRGIEFSSKIFMPLLAVILIILAGYSVTLDGAMEGMRFLFVPDWSALSDPRLYLAAIGQSFFTLSLGMGIMITYGGYLSKQTGSDLPKTARNVVILDTLFAIIVAVAIFGIVYAIGAEPDSGPGLVFMVLPEIFNQMAGAGTLFAIAFFFLVFIAALTSAISLAEVSISAAIERFKISRQKAVLIMGGLITLFGIPSALSQGGPLSGFEIFGLPFLDFVDTVTDSYFLPIGGLIVVLLVGWGWTKRNALDEADFRSPFFAKLYLILLRFVAPIMIIGILLLNIFGVGY